jgi:AmiR/NasT family two-component response regulator
MVLQPPQTRVCSSTQSLKAISRVAQLEAEIAQLKEALRQRQHVGMATDLLARGFAISPEQPVPSQRAEES